MTENSVPIKKESDQVTPAANLVKNLLKLQKDPRVILCMPKDLCDLYKESLINRLKYSGINLTITMPDMLPEEFSSYNWILSYQCSLPASGCDNEPDPNGKPDTPPPGMDLFEIKGGPSEDRMIPFPRVSSCLTELENRFLLLKNTIQIQEKDEHFQNLAKKQQEIRLKLFTMQQEQLTLDQLISRAQAVGEGYYHVLGYYMQEAIDSVLQLVSLGDVMKKYTKVLVIDYLGEHSIDQLEVRGFRKRFLSTMSQHTFNQTYKKFRQLYQEQFPGQEVTLADFLTKCSVFDEHEIVFYNPWKTSKEGLPVQFRLRKAADLTRKEIRKRDEDPSKVAHKVDKLIKERRKLELQLKNTEYELQTSESKGGLSESSYVALNKKRKRILRYIATVSEKFIEIQKEVDDRPDLTLINRDFLLALKDRKTVKLIKAQKALRDKDQINLNPSDLQTMAGLMKQKKEKERQVRLLNSQVKLTLEKIQEYAEQYLADPEKTYQQVLGVHTLNKLEMTVLGCQIATTNGLVNDYRGPYFQERWGKSAVDWNDDPLSRVAFYLASRHITISTARLQKFFRIDTGDIAMRIENSPALPKIMEFNNEKLDLFILNFDSYTYEEIVDCLKMRNRSERPFVPVLILDVMGRIAGGSQKTALDLLIGLKKDAAGNFDLATPPYLINSLDDPAILSSRLCEVMGIDENTVPSFADQKEDKVDDDDEDDSLWNMECTNLSGQSQISMADGESGTPLEAQEAVKLKKPAPPPAAISKNGSIQMSVSKEIPEEIYTLGSLFSFADDTPARDQQITSTNAPLSGVNPETEKQAPDTMEGGTSLSDESDEPVSPEEGESDPPESPTAEEPKRLKPLVF